MRNFFDRIRTAFIRFMSGRYGTDKLNRTLIITALVFEVLYFFTKFFAFSVISLLLLIWSLVRTFSRNIPKRYAENQKFLKILDNIKMRKDYHIYRCDKCGQKIRVPRKGGKRVEIRCPKCGNTFIKKI